MMMMIDCLCFRTQIILHRYDHYQRTTSSFRIKFRIFADCRILQSIAQILKLVDCELGMVVDLEFFQ